jgi:hypothetical protein
MILLVFCPDFDAETLPRHSSKGHDSSRLPRIGAHWLGRRADREHKNMFIYTGAYTHVLMHSHTRGHIIVCAS